MVIVGKCFCYLEVADYSKFDWWALLYSEKLASYFISNVSALVERTLHQGNGQLDKRRNVQSHLERHRIHGNNSIKQCYKCNWQVLISFDGMKKDSNSLFVVHYKDSQSHQKLSTVFLLLIFIWNNNFFYSKNYKLIQTKDPPSILKNIFNIHLQLFLFRLCWTSTNHPKNKILDDLLRKLEIEHVAWYSDKTGNYFQVIFPTTSGEPCETTLHCLVELGIGKKYNSSVR